MIGLSATAVALYLFTPFLRTFAENLSGGASDEVMKKANQLTMVGNQDTLGRRYFLNITNLCASLISSGIAFAVIILINPFLTMCFVFLFSVQYAGVVCLLRARNAPHRFVNKVREKPEDFLQSLFNTNFWLAFLLILLPLLAGIESNTFFAILSFVLVRQALRSLVAAISTAINLASKRHLIDALMLPQRKWQLGVSRVSPDFHSLFEREAHLMNLETVLADNLKDSRPVSARLQDSPLKGVATFILKLGSGSTGTLFFQEQVFSPYQAHLIKNEEILFTHVRRELLNAPTIIRSFTYGSFQCRICDYGIGAPVSASAWHARLMELLEQIWSIKPPDRLVAAFGSSRALLHDRLTSELIERLALAVDSESGEADYRAFGYALPAVRAVLSMMPLCVSNPDMLRPCTAAHHDGKVSIMLWGRWALEPIGANLPEIHEEKLAEIIARLQPRRPDILESLTPDHLRLAAACKKLENHITESQYEAALRLIPAILESPLLSTGPIDVEARRAA
jgi:hypothetical protein